MSIIKAILLTILLIFVFSLTQIGFTLIFYQVDVCPEFLTKSIALSTGISFVVAYLIVFKVFWEEKINLKRALSLRIYEPKSIGYLILIGIGLQLMYKPFWDIGKIWGHINSSAIDTPFSYFKGFSLPFIYNLFIILLINPVLEELFFRKFLLSKLLENNSQIISIAISSLCFLIIHLETPLNLIPAFIFGIISSLIFIKTRNIGYSVLLHFLSNLFVQILYVFGAFDQWLLNLNFNAFYWLLFLLGIATTYLGTKKLLTTTKYA